MKKEFLLIGIVISVVAVLIFLLVIPQNTDGTKTEETAEPTTTSLFTDDEIVFNATVLKNEGTSLLVEPEEGSSVYKTSDKFSIALLGALLVDSSLKEISVDDFKPNNRVEITFTGGIRESYPAQVSAIRVKKIS